MHMLAAVHIKNSLLFRSIFNQWAVVCKQRQTVQSASCTHQMCVAMELAIKLPAAARMALLP